MRASLVISALKGSEGIVPWTLFRIQPGRQVKVCRHAQQGQGQGQGSSYDVDVKVQDDCRIHPSTDTDFTPSGMLLHPRGEVLERSLREHRWPADTKVYRLQQGTKLPDGLCIFGDLCDEEDMWYLQASRAMTPHEFGAQVTSISRKDLWVPGQLSRFWSGLRMRMTLITRPAHPFPTRLLFRDTPLSTA